MTTRTMAALALGSVLAAAPLVASADGGGYVGASIGSATLTDDFDGFNVDADSSAFRAVLGYQFGDVFGLEAGYHRFGTFEEEQDFRFRLDADGFTLGATLGVPLSDSVRLFARGGAFYWDGDSLINSVTRASPDESNLYLGAGAEVELTRGLSLIGDWTRYELDYTDSDVISLGLTLRF